EALIRLISECLDPIPEKRPTALELLAVCLKAKTSVQSIRISESFWQTLLETRLDKSSTEINGWIAATTRRFISEYVGILNTTFSDRESCLLMSLQSMHVERGLLSAANGLAKNTCFRPAGSTIFHIA